MPLLVPQVDEDGNERAGIRLPEIAVPLATYTGWNFRKPEIGAPGELVPLLGASILFPATRAARGGVEGSPSLGGGALRVARRLPRARGAGARRAGPQALS